MIINPYRIHPNEDWEIEEILNKEEELINNKTQFFLFLLKKYLSNFYHGVEKYHSSSGALNTYEYYEDIENLTFNKCYYPEVNSIITDKLRKVILDLNKMYSVNDINITSIKNNDQFISISPFLYDLRTWSDFIEIMCKKHYSKNLKSFKTKTELTILDNLKYLEIDKIWNINEEVHYLLSFEDFHRVDREKEHIDIIKDCGFENEENLNSYKFQQKNKHSNRYIFKSKVFIDILRSINLKPKVKTHLIGFDTQLSKEQLVYLYEELEDQLDFFDTETTKEIWCDVFLKKFKDSEKVILTPKNNSQVYYFFTLMSEFTIEKKRKIFYLYDKFFINKENADIKKYKANKASYSKAMIKYNTFKGKTKLDSIFQELKK